jgi:hypothetical protein
MGRTGLPEEDGAGAGAGADAGGRSARGTHGLRGGGARSVPESWWVDDDGDDDSDRYRYGGVGGGRGAAAAAAAGQRGRARGGGDGRLDDEPGSGATGASSVRSARPTSRQAGQQRRQADDVRPTRGRPMLPGADPPVRGRMQAAAAGRSRSPSRGSYGASEREEGRRGEEEERRSRPADAARLARRSGSSSGGRSSAAVDPSPTGRASSSHDGWLRAVADRARAEADLEAKAAAAEAAEAGPPPRSRCVTPRASSPDPKPTPTRQQQPAAARRAGTVQDDWDV